MQTRLLVALVLIPLTIAIVFGSLLILIASVPGMLTNAEYFIPAAIKASLLVAGPLAWECAPALMTDKELYSD
jgi:hypothetical protein